MRLTLPRIFSAILFVLAACDAVFLFQYGQLSSNAQVWNIIILLGLATWYVSINSVPILPRVVIAGSRRFRHAITRWLYLGLLIVVLLVSLTSGGEQATLSGAAKASWQVYKY